MKQRRRRGKFYWLFAAAAVAALVLQEQVAVLYVLSTLAICGLLIVVGLSNLEAGDKRMQAAAISEADDISNYRGSSRGERRAA